MTVYNFKHPSHGCFMERGLIEVYTGNALPRGGILPNGLLTIPELGAEEEAIEKEDLV